MTKEQFDVARAKVRKYNVRRPGSKPVNMHNIDPDVWARLKAHSKKSGQPMVQVVEGVLRDFLDRSP